MKKLFVIVFCLALIGCGSVSTNPVPVPPPAPVPVNPTPVPVPSAITERDNGKTFTVKAGSTIKFTLTVGATADYFWAFSQLGGDFEVLSDTRISNTQTLTVKVNSPGKLGLQYCQFAPDGAKIISQLSFSIVD
jgi:hypothetical protein